MAKAKKLSLIKNDDDAPKKVLVGDLVLRQIEENGVKWETVFNEISQSPSIKILQEAMNRAKEISEMVKIDPYITDAVQQMVMTQKQLEEPMNRLKEQVEQIRKFNEYHIPKALQFALADLPTLPQINFPTIIPDLEERAFTIPITKPPAVVIKEEMARLEVKLGHVVEETIKARFDNFAEQNKIPVGIKNANCHCSKCGYLLMKVVDISYLMQGTMKCSGCKELLNLPRDLNIKAAID